MGRIKLRTLETPIGLIPNGVNDFNLDALIDSSLVPGKFLEGSVFLNSVMSVPRILGIYQVADLALDTFARKESEFADLYAYDSLEFDRATHPNILICSATLANIQML